MRIDSARDTAWFASSTAPWISAVRSGSAARSATVALRACRAASSSAPAPPASSVTRQAMNGRPSPTTRHWLISGWARSRSSSTAGATFLPPAVTISSFFRPVTRRKPSSSSSPRSPVRSQPSSSERLRRGGLVLPVAGEHVRALDQDLAVLGDPHADAGQRLPHGADLVAGRLVHHRGGRRLGQAVALQDGQADPAEEVAQPLAERRAAGHRVLDLAAHRVPQLAVHQPVEQAVPQPPGPGPSRRARRGPGSRRRPCLTAAWKMRSWPALAAACCWAELKTFSNTRGTASRNVGRNSGSPSASVLASGQCPRIAPGLQAADLDDPREGVRQRQEQQRRAARRSRRPRAAPRPPRCGRRPAGCGGSARSPWGAPSSPRYR